MYFFKDEAKDSKRIIRLCFFADYLCGLKQPVFIYNVQQKTYHPALKSSIHSERSKSPVNEHQVDFLFVFSLKETIFFLEFIN